MISSRNNHVAVVEFLLLRGAQVDLPSAEGTTALYYAASEGHMQCKKCLLGVECQQTPLITGAELLLRYGASVHPATATGRTPLFLAAKNGHDQMVELLLSKGEKWEENGFMVLNDSRSGSEFATRPRSKRSDGGVLSREHCNGQTIG